MKYFESGAIFTDDGDGRLALWRKWDLDKPELMFLMHSPSTASYVENDKTLEKCIRLAKKWGYGSVNIGNLYSSLNNNYKDFDPENKTHLLKMGNRSDIIICAWGNKEYSVDLRFLPKDKLYCVGTNENGTPKNPLYIKESTIPITYNKK